MTELTVTDLRHPDAIRERCRFIAARCEAGAGWWRVDRDRLQQAAELVAEVTSATYPCGDIPLHGRWSHFDADGLRRTARLPLPDDRVLAGRMRVGLVVVSVLLDAGAGAEWSYVDAAGITLRRSEGLAVASLEAYLGGVFSGEGLPQADASGLARLTVDRLADAFQAQGDNRLLGLEGRVELMRRLGSVASRLPGERVGGLFDLILARSRQGRLPAAELLGLLLRWLAELWPHTPHVEGRPIGDAWPHPALADAEAPLVPFHKLSQWLAFSLVEPLRAGGLEVTDLDRLTALAEYRNGGLLIDTGVLYPVDAGLSRRRLQVWDTEVVEWRALTVTLIDELADLVRRLLDRPDLTLGQVLEGGTWRAGRELAARLRGGAPPLSVESDGTVF